MAIVIGCAILYVMFLIGFWLAWTDFKPTPVKETDNHPLVPAMKVEPRRKPFTDGELGLQAIDEAALPDDQQRQRKLLQMLHSYAEERPDGAANVLRSWLHEEIR